MKVGDLVRPLQSCGGHLGGVRCESAVVLDFEIYHRDIQVDDYQYESVETHEYQLLCSCGYFEEEGDYIEAINESR